MLNLSGHKTYCGTAHEDDDESPNDASNSHQPGHPEEEDHSKDVLDTWEIDSHQSAELRCLRETNMEIKGLMTLLITFTQNKTGNNQITLTAMIVLFCDVV